MRRQNHFMFAPICLLMAVFLVIFVTKLHHKFDVPIIIGVLFFLLGLLKGRFSYPSVLLPYTVFLFLISAYAIFISLVYGVNEIIFALKFVHTLLLFFLLYFVWLEVKDYISYDKFTKYFVLMVTFHSIIILCVIIFPDFRHALYSVTGYVPRGPEWSRSPGLTSSYSAPVIVHITGLWLLLSRKDWTGWKRWCLGMFILSSLIFLGRFVSFVGIPLILFLLLMRSSWKTILLYGAVIAACLPLLGWFAEIKYDTGTIEGQIMGNYHNFIDSLRFIGSEGGADNYYAKHMTSHIYFSEKWYILLFGDSYAGHMGMMRGASGIGKTNSDLGIINSINANGMIVTAMIFIFYFLMIWESRKKDWQTVAIVALLSLALAFKESGLLVSHATPLLFLLFFYQVLSNTPLKNINKV